MFDPQSLGSLIAGGAVISLRQVLAWSREMPTHPPVPGHTLLVSGLETVIETMPPDKAADFLCHRLRPILIHLQQRWTQCGVVFGFTAHPQAFEETALDEEVLFRRRDRQTVRLSDGLWDGSANYAMQRMVREGESPAHDVPMGYYVARI